MASMQELLDSISPDMKLNKNFFRRVYGYEMDSPGFAEEVIQMLVDAGCKDARYYYNLVVAEYECKREEEMKRVAEWYKKQSDKEYEYRQGKVVKECTANSKKELLRKRRQLLRRSLQT